MKKPRNPFERKLAGQLKKSRLPYEYESMKVPYTIEGVYIPDFVREDGRILIEAKGYFRYEAKRKMLAAKKTNPHLDIRLIFYSKKDKDIKWAEKNGFKWAIGSVPDSWLSE